MVFAGPTSITGLSPANNTNTSDSTPTFSFTVEGTNGSYLAVLYISNSTMSDVPYNESVVNNNTASELTANDSLGDGTYTWYVNATNSSTIQSEVRTVTINTANPTVTVNTAAGWKSANFTVNATVTDSSPGVDTVYYRLENSSWNGSWTQLSSGASNTWTTTFGITSIADDNYTLRVNASDLSGNENTTETILVRIDDTNPSVSVTGCTTINAGSSHTCSCSASDNSESFGGSVTTSISVDSTSTSGTKTATCTATDSASNSATGSATFTVNPGETKGGGGGGGAATSKSQTIIVLDAGKNVFDLLDTGTGVTEVELDLKISASNVKVSVLKYDEKPASVDIVATGEIYGYLDIEVTNVDENNLNKVDIGFRVEKSWLDANNIESVVLKKLVNGAWTDLVTKKVKEDASYVYYEAESSSLSMYAISGVKKAEAVPEITEEIVPGEVTDEIAPAPEVPEEKGRGGVVAVIIILIIVAVIIGLVKLWPKKRSHKPK